MAFRVKTIKGSSITISSIYDMTDLVRVTPSSFRVNFLNII